MSAQQGRARVPLDARFWSKVDMRGGPHACWPWTARRDQDGYGQFRIDGRCDRAHRVAYLLVHGPVPAGLVVRHACDNPPCANPAHLSLGSHHANMQDRRAAGHYPRGEAHPVARVTDADVLAIRADRGTHAAIAARFGISRSHVGRIRRGEARMAPTFINGMDRAALAVAAE